MPALQRMEDDPAFLEYRERRFERDDPPPPYSSRSTTREPTPEPFPQIQSDIDLADLLRQPLSDHEIDVTRYNLRSYSAYGRYYNEECQEQERIARACGRRDENHVPLYRGPDLIGRPGQQRMRIMIRHSIKKRWQQLGVWDPKWGDVPKEWPWWNSGDGETPESRAIRRYLQKKAHENESLTPQAPEAKGPAEVPVDDDESLITSRPWFIWALEVAEEETRLRRNPERLETFLERPDTFFRARANVTARWKEKGWWKDSWSNNLPNGTWRHWPGWKWKHESPSPEPPDPNDMEFTPSEVDALEAIRPPTPPPPPKPSSLEDRSPPPGSYPIEFFFFPSRNAAPPISTLPRLTPTDDDGDHEDSRSGTAAELMGEESAQRLLEDNADMAPRAEQSRSSTRVASRKQQRQPTTRHPLTRSNGRTTCSTARVDISSPAARKTRQGRKAAGAPISSSKISKPTPTRRSLRIAEREGRSGGVGAPPEAINAMNKDDMIAQPQLNQQAKETSTRTTRRKTDRTKGRHPPTPSKPQGVAKRKGRSRRLNA
ncbi:hypothetical protein LTS15_010967 [Exophiala xenobiotica]|nr:hypothetical protein LTS15_010967 [Exophiala xenobiotica]